MSHRCQKNNEGGRRVNMCFKAIRSAFSSVVRVLESGGRGYLKARVEKVTAKPAPEADLEHDTGGINGDMIREMGEKDRVGHI